MLRVRTAAFVYMTTHAGCSSGESDRFGGNAADGAVVDFAFAGGVLSRRSTSNTGRLVLPGEVASCSLSIRRQPFCAPSFVAARSHASRAVGEPATTVAGAIVAADGTATEGGGGGDRGLWVDRPRNGEKGSEPTRWRVIIVGDSGVRGRAVVERGPTVDWEGGAPERKE